MEVGRQDQGALEKVRDSERKRKAPQLVGVAAGRVVGEDDPLHLTMCVFACAARSPHAATAAQRSAGARSAVLRTNAVAERAQYDLSVKLERMHAIACLRFCCLRAVTERTPRSAQRVRMWSLTAPTSFLLCFISLLVRTTY